MSSPIISQQNNRAGLCPHGLPPSACPICSSSGMSVGRNKMQDSPLSKSSSREWTWLKCYAVGLAMKAQENRELNNKSIFEKQVEFAKQLSRNIQNLSEKIKLSVQNLEKMLPNSFRPLINFVSNVIISPILKLITQIPFIIEKFAYLTKNLTEIINQVFDKFVSIFGEIKNFIERKFSENFKKKIKKFFLFFTSDVEDKNYKNDDNLYVFESRELKKYIKKL